MSMRSKASLTLAPIPHHHSEKASLSLHDQGWISSNSSPAPSLSTVLENVFQMKGRAKQHKSTLGPHQHAGGVQQRQLRPGFRPLCAPHTYMFSSPMLGAHRFFLPGAFVHCIYAVRSVKALDGFDFSIATFFHKMQVETCGSLLDIAYTWTY